MLIDPDGNPSRSIYFIGAKVLEYMQESRFKSFDMHRTYREVNENTALSIEKFSFEHFLLALDWLYLLGAVEIDENGDVLHCS